MANNVPIQPLADYIVAQTEEAAKKTASGLYIPGGAQEKPTVAKVVAIAPHVKSVAVGDRIIYKSYSQTEVRVENETYLLVQEPDVLARVK
ncbi:molecular chaperone GroES [Candidatus Saccharibacteria bacterium]|nr:MAG: molecular chaperone GroES [Candidatus Saccharibacteria bacterium]PID99667.1 MAG: molecular chaperone GroES [Candidatus Saccharibacteria bacterium]